MLKISFTQYILNRYVSEEENTERGQFAKRDIGNIFGLHEKNSAKKVEYSYLWGRATIESGHGNTPLTNMGIFSVLLVSIVSGIGLHSLKTITSKTDCIRGEVWCEEELMDMMRTDNNGDGKWYDLHSVFPWERPYLFSQ